MRWQISGDEMKPCDLCGKPADPPYLWRETNVTTCGRDRCFDFGMANEEKFIGRNKKKVVNKVKK